MFLKIGVFRNLAKFTEKQQCQSLFFNKKTGFRSATLPKKKTPAQVFSSKLIKVFKEDLWATVSKLS